MKPELADMRLWNQEPLEPEQLPGLLAPTLTSDNVSKTALLEGTAIAARCKFGKPHQASTRTSEGTLWPGLHHGTYIRENRSVVP